MLRVKAFYAFIALATTWLPMAKAELVLTESLMNLFNDSIFITSFTTDSGLRAPEECTDCENLQYFRTNVDGRLVTKRKGRCFAAFRGNFNELEDQRYNDGASRQSCNADGVCCQSRGNVRNVYFSFLSGLNLQWEQAVKDCVETCDDPDDCLILVGHSFGGQYAVFSSFVLAKYNPMVIVTGAPFSFENDCPPLNTDRLYYIHNTMYYPTGELAIDDAGYANIERYTQVGHKFIISRNDTTSVAYYGPDELLPDFDRVLTSHHSHDLFGQRYSYTPVFDKILSNTNFPVPLGWALGSSCLENKTCRGDAYCDGVCKSL